MIEAPRVHYQGKIVIDSYDNGEFWMMYPDGEIQVAFDKAQAELLAKRWFKRHIENAINAGVIEWRTP